MINPEKYVMQNIISLYPKEIMFDNYVKMVNEIQKDAYNQAIEDVLNINPLTFKATNQILKLKK